MLQALHRLLLGLLLGLKLLLELADLCLETLDDAVFPGGCLPPFLLLLLKTGPETLNLFCVFDDLWLLPGLVSSESVISSDSGLVKRVFDC